MTQQATTQADGRYLEIDGRPAVEFTRTYPHTIDRLWHVLTDADESEHWFPSRVEMQRFEGGEIYFRGGKAGQDAPGTILTWDEPNRLGFTWSGGEVHFELAALEGEATRMILTNILASADRAAMNCAGWETCLVGLDRLLAGTPDAPPHLDQSWDERYARYQAAGVPSGAPIPGR